jgi:hypothetical protein
MLKKKSLNKDAFQYLDHKNRRQDYSETEAPDPLQL